MVSHARAQEQGYAPIGARPSVDPRAGTSVEPVTPPKDTPFAFGGWFGWFKDPIEGPSRRVVGTRRMVDFTVAANVGSRLLLGADLPLVIQESRLLTPAVAGVSRSAGTGLGDLGVHGKLTLLRGAQLLPHGEGPLGGAGIALLGRLTLPTGDPATFAAERNVSGQLALLFDYDALIVGIQGSAGFRLRSARADLEPGLRYGNEIPVHVALWLRPSLFGLDPGERQRWEIGLHGALPAGPVAPFVGDGAAALSPFTLRFGDRVQVGKHRDVTLTGGFEIGLTRAFGAPDFGMFVGLAFGPRDHDRDHDGIDDEFDMCPDVPEDFDGVEDRDGCPEDEPPPDRDRDGIADKDDACPDEPGLVTDDLRCHGCAIGDADHDGVDDHDDRCPNEKGVPPDGCPPTETP